MLVTGLGMISPLGASSAMNWEAVKQNKCAIKTLSEHQFAHIDCKIGGPLTTEVFNPNDYKTSFNFRTASLANALAA